LTVFREGRRLFLLFRPAARHTAQSRLFAAFLMKSQRVLKRVLRVLAAAADVEYGGIYAEAVFLSLHQLKVSCDPSAFIGHFSCAFTNNTIRNRKRLQFDRYILSESAPLRQKTKNIF
jgi:hypothetical protein